MGNNKGNNTNDKGTPDPLQWNNINVTKDMLWCVACQSPHSFEHCAVTQFISSQEVEKEEDPKEGNTDNTIWNMVGSSYEYESDEDCVGINQDVVYKR